MSENHIRAAEGVQWWLRREAAGSTFDRNKYLDDLAEGRDSFMNRSNQKMADHITRIKPLLDMYVEKDIPPRQKIDLTAKLAFCSLMFLSGSYRRQRYLQASDQGDYYDRKLSWRHPGGVEAVEFFSGRLDRDMELGVDEPGEVTAWGAIAVRDSESAIRKAYDRAPDDFGVEDSESVAANRTEQCSWLIFLSKLMARSSVEFGLPPDRISILEPKTITEAQPTTLAALLP